MRVAKEEGVSAFYRGLPPRLVSVVPMIGIQFTVYEFMKRTMQKRALAQKTMEELQPQVTTPTPSKPFLPLLLGGKKRLEEQPPFFDPYSSLQILQEASMEVAASPEHPYPAPHFLRIMRKKNKDRKERKKKRNNTDGGQ